MQMDNCDSILDQGIRDRTDFSSSEHLKETVRKMFSYDYETYMQERNKSGGGGGLDVFDIFSISGGGSSDKERFESLKQELLEDESKFFESTLFQDLYTEITNESIVDAWIKCKELEAQNKAQVVAFYKGNPYDRYTLTLRYQPDEGTDNELKITGVTYAYSQPLHPLTLKDGAVLDRYSAIAQLFLRTDPTEDEAITITFDNAQEVTVELPKAEKTPLTTIASGLINMPHATRPTGEFWEEVYTQSVSFAQKFNSIPNVVLSVKEIESYTKDKAGVFYKLHARNVTSNGFEFVLVSAYNSSFSNIIVNWIAIGT